ncbi:MAG: peptidoglycan editing factor PgeF [Oscillospiraceae bacterium]|nr:peptidoglycan editing factor PgeF [Oscillospiraceae bacterium]
MMRTQIFKNIPLLVAESITVPHGFTSRIGGVSVAPYDSLNLGLNRGDADENVAENRRLLAEALGYEENKLVLTRQTHSDIVRVVTDQDALGIDHRAYPEADGLVTCTPGVALWVFTADCTPILLEDPVTGAVGAVHAGWRGTASKIAAKAVSRMQEAFGSRPEDIRAAIGPAIGVCCFETDKDVPDAMLAAFGEEASPCIFPKGSKYFVDIKALNALALRNAGVQNITLAEDCTMCLCHKYWSHRKTRGIRGSQGGIIVCKEVAK